MLTFLGAAQHTARIIGGNVWTIRIPQALLTRALSYNLRLPTVITTNAPPWTSLATTTGHYKSPELADWGVFTGAGGILALSAASQFDSR